MAVPVFAAQSATLVVDRADDADVSGCSAAANDCTLRGAINVANNTASNPGADTIVFAENVRGTLALVNGQLPLVNQALTIVGPGAGALALDANSGSRLFRVVPDVSFAIEKLTLRNGVAPSGQTGGAIYSQSNLTVSDCVFLGNSAPSGGGAIDVNNASLAVTSTRFSNNTTSGSGGAIRGFGTSALANVVFTGNSANSSGGGFIGIGSFRASGCSFADNRSQGSGGGLDVTSVSAPIAIVNSTFANNVGRNGGGLSISAIISESVNSIVSNCTFSGNRATVQGGGIYTNGKNLFESVTITDNVAPPGKGSGIAATGGEGEIAQVKNSLVVGSRASGSDIDFVFDLPRQNSDSFVSLGYNLIGNGNASASFRQTGDRIGASASNLGPLRDNGGPTQTIALLPGNLAIDAGQTALATDQRGIARPQGNRADIGAFEAMASAPETPSLTVTTLADIVANDGQTSLREALIYANSKAGADTITFAAGLRGEITLGGSQLPVISDELTINGLGSGVISINGAGRSRALEIAAGKAATVRGLTFSMGQAQRGGAILNNGALTVENCVFAGNGAIASDGTGGGAISNGANMTVRQCAFSGNTAVGRGGAIDNIGLLSIDKTTFANNEANADGGGVFTVGNVKVTNSTFSMNAIPTGFRGGGICSGDGGLNVDSSTFTLNEASAGKGGGLFCKSNGVLRNTIVAGNRGDDVASTNTGTTPFRSGGHNLVGTGDAAGRFTATGDQRGVTDPRLAPLTNDGNPFTVDGYQALTHALLADSPALNRGDTDLPDDERDVTRPQGGADDIGAYESSLTSSDTPQGGPNFVVNTAGDGDDGVCGTGDCSLREAMNAANASAGENTITFADNVRGSIVLTGRQLPTITAAGGTLLINGPGLSAPQLTIEANGQSRVLQVGVGATLGMSGLIIRGGNAGDDNGGGLYIQSGGSASLRMVSFAGNRANRGGGIYNENGIVLVRDCDFNSNVANNGAAIGNFGAGASANESGGTLFVTSSTLSDNRVGGSSASDGGAIFSLGESARVNVTSSTIAGNAAPGIGGARAGIWQASGALRLSNSIVSGNGIQDIQSNAGALESRGYNIIGNAGGARGFGATDQLDADAKLGDLSYNGGPTQTRALLAGSPALNAGDPTITDGNDQRGEGFARVRGGRVDIGAFEQQDVPSTDTKVAVILTPRGPRTKDLLTTAVNSSGVPDPVYSYVWKKNGVVLPNETRSTLGLGTPGNGDKGDTISVEVTATSADGRTRATQSASAQVVNSAPVTFSGVVSADAGVETVFEFRGADNDDDALTFERVGGPVNGTADIRVGDDGKSRLYYTSRVRYNGSDSIRFVARDNEGRTSNVATLSINVRYDAPPPANRAPIAGDTNIDTFVGTSEVKGLLGSDPDGDALTFRVVGNAKFGRSEIRRDTDGFFKLFYTSLPSFFGPDRVVYIATDSRGKESNLATVNINFVNRAPVAQGNFVQVASGQEVSQFLFGTDEDGDALSFRLVNNPRFGRGEVKLDEQGKWRFFYTSSPGYVGPDQITFIAIDPQGKESQVAAIDINVVRVGGSSAGALMAPSVAPSGGGS